MPRPAYTLLEALIVAVLIAILSVGFTVSVQDVIERNALKSNEAQIVSLIQEARNMALSNKLVDGQNVDFYTLQLSPSQIDLMTDDGTVLSTLVFTKGVTASWEFDGCSEEWRIFYYTKDASLAFDKPGGCAEGTRSREFTLHSPQDKYKTRYSVDVYGGFPQELSEPQIQ